MRENECFSSPNFIFPRFFSSGRTNYLLLISKSYARKKTRECIKQTLKAFLTALQNKNWREGTECGGKKTLFAAAAERHLISSITANSV